MNNRLYRSPDDRVVAGVAGGMAEAWDLDPSLVRVGWVLLAIVSGGIFLLVYIVMALIVPLRPANMPLWSTDDANAGGADRDAAGASPATAPPGYRGPAHNRRNDATGALVLGVLLILAGAYFLARQFIPALDFGLIWPVVVIILGAFLIVAAFARREHAK